MQPCHTWLNKVSWHTNALAEFDVSQPLPSHLQPEPVGGIRARERSPSQKRSQLAASGALHRALGKLRRMENKAAKRDDQAAANSGGRSGSGGGGGGGRAGGGGGRAARLSLGRPAGVAPAASSAASASFERANLTAKASIEALTEAHGRRLGTDASHAARRLAAEPPSSSPHSVLTAVERKAAEKVATRVRVPAALAAASEAAATLHPRGLVAFAHPIPTADRREYQIYVHMLMSAAMLTRRKPVLPLALCAMVGEWSARSRCIYVLHAAHPKGAEYCVQRPPSICHGKVALPNELENVPEAEVGAVTLPRLPLVNGSVNIEALGAALGARGRDRRVLLLDTAALKSADDISNLLVTPKGWLCTLEHKSCQNAC